MRTRIAPWPTEEDLGISLARPRDTSGRDQARTTRHARLRRQPGIGDAPGTPLLRRCARVDPADRVLISAPRRLLGRYHRVFFLSGQSTRQDLRAPLSQPVIRGTKPIQMPPKVVAIPLLFTKIRNQTRSLLRKPEKATPPRVCRLGKRLEVGQNRL